MAIGKIGTFDMAKDRWDSYVDRLEQYFIANDVKTEAKVATLITVVGSDAYDLMVNLCTPEKPSTKTFTALVSLMKNYLNPKPSILAERFKFRQRTQKQEEKIAEYVNELKRLSKDCGFTADGLKENLRDQFVCGLRNDEIRQKLFTEDDSITFDKAFKIARSMEEAEANAALVESRSEPSSSTGSASVHHMGRPFNTSSAMARSTGRTNDGGRSAPAARRGGMRTLGGVGGGPSGTGGAAVATSSGRYRNNGGGSYSSKNSNELGATTCNVCGEKHYSASCKFKLYVCRVCNQEGHLKRMCPRLRATTSTMHNMEEQGGYQNSEDSDEVKNYSMKLNNFDNFGPYTIELSVEGAMLTMEIDTGSSISCISYECFKSMFSSCRLMECNLVLRYYTGETVKPMGMIKPIVKYGDISKRLDLYIIKSGKTNLLGRSWLTELGIGIGVPKVQCYNVSKNNCSFNIEEFSSRFSEVFADGLGRFTGGKVGFHLREGARPVFLRARPLAYALREPVERALDQMVSDGIITPVATSDWATPIVPVMKSDGTIRVCADFKVTLNKCLEVDHYPLPKVEDLLTKLHGGEKFTKLDLSQAYAQLELDESKKFTVINTHKGLFRYNRLIYGLASSPGIFQRKLEQLFSDMPRVGVFLDDVIITGVDNESHLKTLNEVFERLRKYGLRIKKEKCEFFAESVTYLGFIISKQGVHTCPRKITAIKEVPTPSDVSELRSFLGLVMYYAKFVPNISTTLSPLYRLLRKDVKFEWSDTCREAFKRVKSTLVSSEVLAHYSPDLPLVLTTDASGVGVGAVISHQMPGGEERPIAYASRVLNSAEKAYSQIEREALAIIYGVKKFNQYLYGRKFILRTDHKPLVTIFGDKTGIPVMAASRMQRWAVILAAYDYDIEYVRSKMNAADALSRLPVGREKAEVTQITYFNFVQNFLPVTRQTVKENQSKDEVLNKVFYYTQSGWPKECKDDSLKPYFTRKNEIYIDMGCLLWGYRLVIPMTLRDDLLKELHVGHVGIVKMKSLARGVMWWPGIDGDIERTCGECTTCSMESAAPPKAPPQPWPYTTEPWSRLHVDFLGPFEGKMFLILLDSTTKWLEVFPMQTTTAVAVIKVLRETFARFGLPKVIVSDNGPPFTSREYLDFMSRNGIKVTFAPVYHPSSNGAAENAVKLCKRALKKAIRDGSDLNIALQAYLMAYRNVEHSTTGASPAMLLQRRNLRSRLDLLRGDRQVEEKVQKAQERQISNSGGIYREFSPGEEVWARNYTGGRWQAGQVVEKSGSRNYIVERESGPPIKRHVDQIKKRRSSYMVPSVESKDASPVKGVSNQSGIVNPVEGVVIGSDVHSPVRRGEGSRGPEHSGLSNNTSMLTTSPKTSPVSEPMGERSSSSPMTPTDRPKRIRRPVQRYGYID